MLRENRRSTALPVCDLVSGAGREGGDSASSHPLGPRSLNRTRSWVHATRAAMWAGVLFTLEPEGSDTPGETVLGRQLSTNEKHLRMPELAYDELSALEKLSSPLKYSDRGPAAPRHARRGRAAGAVRLEETTSQALSLRAVCFRAFCPALPCAFHHPGHVPAESRPGLTPTLRELGKALPRNQSWAALGSTPVRGVQGPGNNPLGGLGTSPVWSPERAQSTGTGRAATAPQHRCSQSRAANH